MMEEMGAGVKAGVAHGMQASGGSVPEHAFDEFRGGQAQGV